MGQTQTNLNRVTTTSICDWKGCTKKSVVISETDALDHYSRTHKVDVGDHHDFAFRIPQLEHIKTNRHLTYLSISTTSTCLCIKHLQMVLQILCRTHWEKSSTNLVPVPKKAK